MKIIATAGREDIAVVYLAEPRAGKYLELVESVQPRGSREEKWVLLISTSYGCPVRCRMCDAGGSYHGKVSKNDLAAQIDFLVRKRFPDGTIPSKQFKVQFARMGEPSYNAHVLEVLNELPDRYRAPGLIPSVSTIAPVGTDGFFARLLEIKNRKYTGGHFQLQFSIHTTDTRLRDEMVPVRKWGLAEIAAYGEQFHGESDRKITLNFALAARVPVDPGTLLKHFHPRHFLIKITPLNPTYQARENGLSSYIDPARPDDPYPVVQALRSAGYTVIVSAGEREESLIGSNCGQFVLRHLKAKERMKDGYSYSVASCRE
jgi:23S rRNA (adenine2503-C2)-methyltransferase